MIVSTLVANILKTSGVVGVGQVALAEDSTLVFTLLNQMLAQWRRKNLLVYRTQDVILTGTGAQSYTIGTGGTINVARPARIEAAFRRQLVPASPNQVDTPMQILQSRQDYNRIALKTLSPIPMAVFYDPTYPLGTIYPWPVPSSAYEVHLTILGLLPAFANLQETIALPEEYEDALFWNGVKRTRVAYRRELDVQTNLLAAESKKTLRQANMTIPALTMPGGIPSTGGRYNIFTDQGR